MKEEFFVRIFALCVMAACILIGHECGVPQVGLTDIQMFCEDHPDICERADKAVHATPTPREDF
jgi:hypothetical protein